MLRKPEGNLARYAAAQRRDWILADTERHLLTTLNRRPRDLSVIHAAELSRSDFCPRATYYRIVGPALPEEVPPFFLENIFDEGTEIGDKWTRRWREMGILWGHWRCQVCYHQWDGYPPNTCVSCGGAGSLVVYEEVHLADKALLLVGHGDAELRPRNDIAFVEIKSVGTGTLRKEVPRLLAKHTHEVGGKKILDVETIWRTLEQPFTPHLNQGYLYLHMRAITYPDQPPLKEVKFLYEHKGTQVPRVFTVQLDQLVLDRLLDKAWDVAEGVRLKTPPTCRNGRRGCKACIAYER